MDTMHKFMLQVTSRDMLPSISNSLQFLYTQTIMVAVKQKRFDLVTAIIDIIDLRLLPVNLPLLVNVLQVLNGQHGQK